MTNEYFELETVRAIDLEPGDVLASGHVVAAVETGGHRYGDSVHVQMRDGSTGRCGRENRILRQRTLLDRGFTATPPVLRANTRATSHEGNEGRA